VQLALRIGGFLIGLVVVVFVVGGMTEWALGDPAAQFVRKTILLGGSMALGGFLVGQRLKPPQAPPPP
jgi:hypothetical protein